jgi:Tol biopolymer transport system component
MRISSTSTQWTPETRNSKDSKIPRTSGKAILIGLLLVLLFSCSDLGEIPTNYHNRILFTSSRSGVNQLYMVNPDGSDLRPLTEGPYANAYGLWSPNARQIVFSSTENAVIGWDPLIFVMNSDGTSRHSLGVRGNVTGWARDNHRILYEGCPLCEGGGDLSQYIYTINADGTGAQQLTRNPGGVQVFDHGACYSANETRIFFISNRFNPSQLNSELYMMNADGTNLQRLTYYGPGEDSGIPSVSPDGTMIAFGSQQQGISRYGIFVMNTDTTDLRLVIESAVTLDYSVPRWSPNESQLVIRSTKVGQTTINFMDVVNLDGSGLRRVIPDQIEGLPDWSW